MTEHTFTNKLIFEKSPYLLQHAHNPVDWHPWSQEAFEKAKREDTKLKIDFGSQIRNYVLHPYKLVKDIRTSIERTDVENVLNGDLNEFLKSYLLRD